MISIFSLHLQKELQIKKMKHGYVFLLLAWASTTGLQAGISTETTKEKTAFQCSQPWRPTFDVRSDVVMCYGINDVYSLNFEARVKTWRDRGYATHFMTGIAWGNYQDYFSGLWDGKQHLDEGQVAINNDSVRHSYLVPYIVPSLNYIKYFKEVQIKRVIDAGIDAIYLEEPEFWNRSGYSESFKREWQDYYHSAWQAQHLSPQNTYLSNKLKYHLYYRAINEVCNYAKEYGRSKGMNVHCYIPTHSLINYSQWQIVSPEASLASLNCIDGYIAQVWTGTARTKNFFNGIKRERVFETAFLEYGCVESMTAPTHRKVFFLTDPVEDNPRDWQDYKRNYQATFTAELLYPRNNNYEVMPWPERIYEGTYRTSANSTKTEYIPRFYSTQMQVMVNALNNMPLSDSHVSGTQGISVLMANSLMFQHSPTKFKDYSDPQLSNFFGLALPLLKRGIPVSITHLENVGYKDTWKDVKVLLMTYSNMKPLDSLSHYEIAKWVRQGGVLVYCSQDKDPFQSVQEWWNQNGNSYSAPSQHLFQVLGMPKDAADGAYSVDHGKVFVIRKDPKEFVMKANKDSLLIQTVRRAYEQVAHAGKIQFKNSFFLQRGVYDVVSVMDEAAVNNHPLVIKGKLVDLYDPQLPVFQQKIVQPGEQAFLLDLQRIKDKHRPQVLASACRVYDEKCDSHSYSFICKSPINTTNAMRLLLPHAPSTIKVTDNAAKPVAETHSWSKDTNTLLLNFENNPDGVHVSVGF